jgi:type III pantothenate kinase
VTEVSDVWLALAIGNSRLHWAWFEADRLKQTWDTPHVSAEAIAPFITHTDNLTQPVPSASQPFPSSLAARLTQQPLLLIASVVPSQTVLWQSYPTAQTLCLDQIPLRGGYPTLGIDRALAVWSAVTTWNSAALVIDAGTALTFTGADAQANLIGGAILPGVQLQLRSLTHTAALPLLSSQPLVVSRWATNTADAIYSGIVHTILAGIRDFVEDWLKKFPESAIALTGGDSALLFRHFQLLFPHLASRIKVAPVLVFQGMRAVKHQYF